MSTITDEMVRAAGDAFQEAVKNDLAFDDCMRAALAVIREALKEPTPEMVKAVEDKGLEFGEPVECYRVNVAAILAAGLAASPLYPEKPHD